MECVYTFSNQDPHCVLYLELERYNIALAGLCKVRLPSYGECVVGNHCIICSRPTNSSGQCGITLTLLKYMWSSLISWKPVRNWLPTSRLLHKHGKITVTVTFAPTNIGDKEMKHAYYSQLQTIIENVPHMTFPSPWPMPKQQLPTPPRMCQNSHA